MILKPCPFCGGEANGDGYTRYSRPLADVHWADGSEITEAFFINCIECGIDNGRSGLVGGYQTRSEAIAAWNARAKEQAAPDDVERVARALFAEDNSWRGFSWETIPPSCQEVFLRYASAALTAVTPDGLREALEDLPRLIELQRDAAPDRDFEDGRNFGLEQAAAMVRTALGEEG